jgi:hypothetical protein
VAGLIHGVPGWSRSAEPRPVPDGSARCALPRPSPARERDYLEARRVRRVGGPGDVFGVCMRAPRVAKKAWSPSIPMEPRGEVIDAEAPFLAFGAAAGRAPVPIDSRPCIRL